MSGSEAEETSTAHQNDKNNRGIKTKTKIIPLSFLLLLSCAPLVWRQFRAELFLISASSNNAVSTTARRKNPSPLIASLDLSSLAKGNNMSSSSSSSSSSLPSSSGQKLPPAEKQHLPIYLYDASSNITGVTTWGDIAPRWNRTTQYTDLFQSPAAKRVSHLSIPIVPATQTQATSTHKNKKRQVVILHCSPKAGSTTLRKACRINLKETCGIQSKGNNGFPAGYKHHTMLYPLIRSCNATHHFCSKNLTLPLETEVLLPATYDMDVEFIHMFPFRNYDDWAVSALKQQFVSRGEKGCDQYKKKFVDEECTPSHMELDIRQYGKADLSRFADSVVQRRVIMKEKMKGKGEEERHTILLYFYRDLDKTLTSLHTLYGIPLLPRSDGKGKTRRREGTCDASLLQTYHECFSHQLMELT